MDTLPHEKQLDEYVKTIEHLKKQNASNPIFSTEIKRLEQKLSKIKQKVYSGLTPWERVQISRHPQRPHTLDYIKNITESFVELSGDRTYSDDHSIIGGLAKIGGVKFILIGQEKGFDTESRLYRNFGMVNPEGYRKALRIMELGAKFNLPIVTFLDTSGAYHGLSAEERGQSWAIAENLKQMSQLPTPIIVIVIGEGCSGGALAIGVGDRIGMLQHAYYSVITPEACASILWKDPSKNVESANSLKLTAEDLLELNVIDAIINEPLGGAHRGKDEAYANVKKFILDEWHLLKNTPKDVLKQARYLKFRKMGQYLTGDAKAL